MQKWFGSRSVLRYVWHAVHAVLPYVRGLFTQEGEERGGVGERKLRAAVVAAIVETPLHGCGCTRVPVRA
eukprot:6184724-Pleurochrysis_carterae.AAC.4